VTVRSALAGALLLLVLHLLLAYGIYTSLTSSVLGANDFYSRWYGARALFLKGQNPYSIEVTQGIQIGMMGHLATPEQDQVAFAYPLYVAFLVLPLVPFAYAQAQALWMAALILAVVGSVLIILRSYGKRMTPSLFILLIIGALFFYPSARAVLLGQFAIVSFLFLALAFWAILARHDVPAGIFLALATVKPQTAALLVPFIVGWALLRQRWHLAGSAIGAFVALTALASLWVPDWPVEFLRALFSYSGYIRVGAPVQTVLSMVLPSELAGPGAAILGLALVVVAATEWLRASDDIRPAFNITALVTTWTAIRIGSSDQVLLLFPCLFWLLSIWRSGNRVGTAVLGAFLIVVPWVLFVATVRGDWEDPVVTIVLPILALVLYIVMRLVNVNWMLQRREAQ
jgi:hypothetical protein